MLQIIFNNSPTYGLANNAVAWVTKIKEQYELMYSPTCCKDFMHEAIRDYIHPGIGGGLDLRFKEGADLLNEDFCFYIVAYKNNKEHYKKLNQFKKFLNYYEKKNNFNLTQIKECETISNSALNKFKKNFGYLFICDNIYYKAYPLIHIMILLARNAAHFKSMKINDIRIKIPSIIYTLDKENIASSLIKLNYFDIILSNFYTIFDKITLEDFYKKDIKHGKFGINALIKNYHENESMCATIKQLIEQKEYHKKAERLLKKAKNGKV